MKNALKSFLFITSLFLFLPIFGQGGAFIENKGQFHDNVRYKAKLPYGKVYLEYNRFTYLFHKATDFDTLFQHPRIDFKEEYLLRSHAYRVTFKGAQSYPILKPSKKGQGYHNYYLGNDPDKWESKVYTYNEITYKEVYPNIDLRYYSVRGKIKYDWIINAGGKLEDIKMEYEGVDSIKIIDQELYLYTSVNTIKETIPLSYYKTPEGILKTNCTFELKGNTIGFKAKKEKDYPLVIDPKLIFSTYSGSYGDNFGFTATYDSRGNLYSGGITQGDDINGGYPVTNGAIQTTYGGGTWIEPAGLPCDITISKYDSAGNNLLFATYLGGEFSEYPHSLVVNDLDELFIFGTTYSAKFPVTPNAYDTSLNNTAERNTDIIVSKFSVDGTKLLGSTYVGGSTNDGLTLNSTLTYNYSDDYRGDILADKSGNVFVASCTKSNNFPVVNGSKNQPKLDGIAMQLNSDLSQLLWSTFVGGDDDDALYSVKLDDEENVYVAGGTSSKDLNTDNLSIQDTFLGLTDGYIAKFKASDKSLERISYWGTPEKDQIYFIQLDQRGNLFAMGQTEGTVIPSPKTYNIPNTGQFILKIDTTLENILIQTVVGKRPGDPDISPSAFLVDHCDNIYISGWGSLVDPSRHNGSTIGLPVTANAIQPHTDGSDFYLMVLRKDMDSLLYATYFGGDETDDHVDGGTSRFDRKGVVYQSVCSSCPSRQGQHFSDFPISAGAAFDTNYSSRCSNAAFKIDLQISSAVIAAFDPDPILGCNPMKVIFRNASSGGIQYEWDFGDGRKDTVKHPEHTYSKPGIYTITLRVIDSFACNIFDETTRQVEVVDTSLADFNAKFNACTQEFTLENNSKLASTFFWDFGNGETSDEKDPIFKYDDFGTYDIKLVTNPGSPCADSLTKTTDVNNLALEKLFWGNVITPNGDGLNDCWGVYGLLPVCNKLELKVLNRWGQVIYSSKELGACWDGSNRIGSEIVPDGTYYYVLKIEVKDGNTIDAHGTITVIQ